MTGFQDRFAGKVIIVTGAGSGIGRATARRLGAEGGAVACLDLNAETAKQVAAEIEEDGGRAVGLPCDVSDPAQVREVVAGAAGALGRPDILCNIAGIGRFHHSLEMTYDEWKRMIDVNLTGTFLVAQAVLPHLLDRGGVVLNTTSTSGIVPQPWQAAYCASKGGVLMLTKALALEYLDRNVRINAIAPGGVDTPILNDFSTLPEGASMKRIIRYMSPMGFSQPEDVASLYAYVASDEAHYMTGSIVVMDGGITL